MTLALTPRCYLLHQLIAHSIKILAASIVVFRNMQCVQYVAVLQKAEAAVCKQSNSFDANVNPPYAAIFTHAQNATTGLKNTVNISDSKADCCTCNKRNRAETLQN
jgi:hypothetical protein